MEGGAMIYYIAKGQILTVFLSMAHLTAISFPEKVGDYIGGQQGNFHVYELNQGKSLVFKAKEKEFKGNFITFVNSSKYHFNFIYDERYSNKDIELREAEKCHYFSLIKETKSYQLFDCPKSLFFVNKTKAPMQINEMTIRNKSYLSKGPPVYLNGKMIYYQGRTL